jgi:hypothetical protein
MTTNNVTDTEEVQGGSTGPKSIRANLGASSFINDVVQSLILPNHTLRKKNFHCVVFILMAYRFDSNCLLQMLPLDVISYLVSYFRVDVYFEHFNQIKTKKCGQSITGRPYAITSGPEITDTR